MDKEEVQHKLMNINDLPYNVLIKIFSYFSMDDRVLDLCFVCKLWHQVCFDGYFWSKIDFAGRRQITDEILCRSATYSKNVTSAELQSCEKVTTIGLIKFCSLCPNLNEIALNGCTESQISDSTIEAICKNCPNLTHLHFSSLGISDASMFAFAKYLQHLEYVSLNNNSKISDKGAIALVKNCKNLKHINLCHNHLISDEFVRVLVAEERKNPTVESVYVSLTSVTGSGVKMLTTLKNLKKLNFGRVKDISSKDLKLISNLKNLEFLNVGMQEEFNDECLIEIASELHKLSEVHFNGTSITDNSIPALVKNCQLLEGIDIGHTDVSDVGLSLMCEGLPKLKDLRLMKCRKANHNKVQELVRNYPNIEFETFILNTQQMMFNISQQESNEITLQDLDKLLPTMFKIDKKKKRKIASGGKMVEV